MEMFTIAVLAFVVLAIVIVAKTATIVPQQQAYVIENLGKYSRTLRAGFHILVPFVERIAYKHSLKETAIDIPEQVCITRDNVQVGVDGVLYLQVLDPERASYGIQDYIFAISQLAQTTLRSEIGKIDLDRTFEERATINANVVREVDMASDPWGVKILRYEIRNINPPRDVIEAMEKQMRAEREKRAVILESEGVRDAQINRAEGEKQKVDQGVRGHRQQSQINEAEGRGRGDRRRRARHRRGAAPGRRSARCARRRRRHATARRRAVRRAVRRTRQSRQHPRGARQSHRRRLDDRAGDQARRGWAQVGP